MIEAQNISPSQAWILATRPKTLPAAIGPVLIGSALAFADDCFSLYPALAALAVAMLLQIGVNLANDYFDHVKGIDTDDRLGPLRVTQSGLIVSHKVKRAMVLTFTLAALCGVYLITVGGWPVVLIGGAAILSALAYSGGPFPLASHGLGDLFVFIFFGLVAVCGTYYVQCLTVTWMAILAAAAVGLFITAILVVNNLRDIESDRKAGKHTLGVLLGQRGTKWEFILLLTGAYIFPFIIWIGGWEPFWILLPLLSLPLAVALAREVWYCTIDPGLNQTLSRTAKLSLIYCILLALGLVLSS